MLKELPTLIDPKRLALQGCNLKGRVVLAEMSRLRENFCFDSFDDVEIDWLFATNEQNRSTIKGSVQTKFKILCQRCLQPMLWSIDAKVALMILPEGQIEDDLSIGYEAITLTSPSVSLITLVEDELILALPVVAMHTTCPSNKYQLPENLTEKENAVQNNPFSVLAKLKNKK